MSNSEMAVTDQTDTTRITAVSNEFSYSFISSHISKQAKNLQPYRVGFHILPPLLKIPHD